MDSTPMGGEGCSQRRHGGDYEGVAGVWRLNRREKKVRYRCISLDIGHQIVIIIRNQSPLRRGEGVKPSKRS
jgi:hypothetical protein